MSIKVWILLALLALIALAPVWLIAYYESDSSLVYKFRPNRASDFFMELQLPHQFPRVYAGKEFNVLDFRIVDEYNSLLLIGKPLASEGTWVVVKMTNLTTQNIEDAIQKWLADCAAPEHDNLEPFFTLILLQKFENVWLVDFDISYNGHNVHLLELLKSK